MRGTGFASIGQGVLGWAATPTLVFLGVAAGLKEWLQLKVYWGIHSPRGYKMNNEAWLSQCWNLPLWDCHQHHPLFLWDTRMAHGHGLHCILTVQLFPRIDQTWKARVPKFPFPGVLLLYKQNSVLLRPPPHPHCRHCGVFIQKNYYLPFSSHLLLFLPIIH